MPGGWGPVQPRRHPSGCACHIPLAAGEGKEAMPLLDGSRPLVGAFAFVCPADRPVPARQ